MLEYSFNRLAQDEIENSALRYEAIQSGLGIRFVARVEECISLIRQFPEIGSPGVSNTRRFGVDSFPYTIVYRRLADEIRVVAVASQSRRPTYWRRRK